MDPQRWRKVEELFHHALGRPPAERDAWLDEACTGDSELRAEVASLLASDRTEAQGFVGASVEQAVLELQAESAPAPRTMIGRQVGQYRLIQELGRGGMGAVYLAARADEQYESKVAIKLVRPGLDTDFILRRFRRERQILAHLQHPNIARLFDGGTTEDDIPYLVMEYIDGSWITTYAREHQLNLEARLRLFLPVCDAVEYAHRNFIVHRDLKPGNIMIDKRGTPKLLDFGVSKLLHGEQRDLAETQGVGMMTPDYASPEQILGEPVIIASDVYSLGAVLYELLTGVRPHRIEQCTPLALERAICLDPVAPPSQAVRDDRALSRRLSGDIDNIILRAMQKEPERRYASVEHLADDLRRYLEHRPVVARPDSLAYRVSKFVRRNRFAVVASLLLAFAVGAGVALLEREARIAQERFGQVRKLATTFLFDVELAVRDLPGSIRVRQLIARTGRDYLDNLSRSSGSDWDLKRELATAYLRVGEVEGGNGPNLGDPEGGLNSYRKAAALLDSVLSHRPSDRQTQLDRMTVFFRTEEVQLSVGRVGEARQSAQDGLTRAQSMLASKPDDLDVAQFAAVFNLDLARIDQQQGNLDKAAAEITAAMPLLRQIVNARPNDREPLSNMAASHARLGAVMAALGRRDEALVSYRAGVAALESMQQHFPNDTHVRHELMLAYSHVGDTLGNPAYDNAGDAAGALESYSQMVAIAKSLYDADHSDFRALSDYGIAQLREGIVTAPGPGKRAILESAHQNLTEAAQRNAKNTTNGMHKAWAEVELGRLFEAGGDSASGARYYQMAIASAEAVLAIRPQEPSAQRWLVAASSGLAGEQARSGARAPALATLDKALKLAQEADRTAAPESVSLRSNIARTWQAAGGVYARLASTGRGAQRDQDIAAARTWYGRAIAEWRKIEPQKEFSAPLRREMEAAAAALAALAPGRTTP
ncbi:MAG: serine/threonine protein kinase [Acidobacteriia bacterium]|nr:serine/threonine protein kinase [Terriglobia bacterium]